MAGAERSSDHPRMLIGLSDRHCFEPSAGIAVRSIQNAPQIWPSGSAMSRPYMEPCSCTGLMSAVPPFAAAAAFIASTDSRPSQDRLSATSPDVDGGLGRLVNIRHFAFVTSMSVIASLHTLHAASPSVQRGPFKKTNA